MRKIHGVNASPFVRKVRIAMAEKGLDYELEPVMPLNVSDEYKKISPLGKIPTYEEDGWTVPDSSVIISYLEQSQPEPALYPADARDRATALFLEEYADTAVVSAAGTVFFQRIVAPAFMGQPTDDAVVRNALEEELPPVLDYLESQLADGRSYLVGDAFSVADIAVTSPFVNLRHAGESVDPSRWPKTAGYLENGFARASIAPLIEEEAAQFSAG